MVAPTMPGEAAETVTKDFPIRQVKRWCRACHTFILWEREYILMKDPSPVDKEWHRSTLKWLLRLSRLFEVAVSDPDFPDRSARDMVRFTVEKLDHSWSMIYEPMPEAEADKLAAQIFPE